MRILVFGAGVLGSLYAAKLTQAGEDVIILARGQRLADINRHGIVLESYARAQEVVHIPAVDRVTPKETFDLVIVLVRKNQVQAILPTLAAICAPSILFMVNNASGYAEWEAAVGQDRLLVGFAGAGGTRNGHVVRYRMVPGVLQSTTLGELSGQKTTRVQHICRMFRKAGFPTTITPNIEAWQKTHVAWVSPVANAIYIMEGDQRKLAKSTHTLQLLVQAIREGFRVLHTLQLPVTPTKLQMMEIAPEWLLVAILRAWANTRHFRMVAVEHSLAAADEMALLADEFHALGETAKIATPAMDELRMYIPRSTSAS